MSTQARGLRALCPQCCGTTLTIAMPTPAEVKRTTGRNHPGESGYPRRAQRRRRRVGALLRLHRHFPRTLP